MSDRIDVLVPSRGRPRSVLRLRRAIDSTAADPDAVLLRVRIDDDDPRGEEYERVAAQHEGSIVLTSGPRIRLARSWDELGAQASADGASHIAMWGDDNVPETIGWDKMLTDTLRERGPGFVYAQDGVWDHTYDRNFAGHLVLPTATMWPISLYRALGWVSPLQLTHLCIDLAWRDLGIEAGCLWFRRDVTIRHIHRCVGAPDDQTYRDANDDPAQFASDRNGYSRWRSGPDFSRDLTRIAELRERWSRSALMF